MPSTVSKQIPLAKSLDLYEKNGMSMRHLTARGDLPGDQRPLESGGCSGETVQDRAVNSKIRKKATEGPVFDHGLSINAIARKLRTGEHTVRASMDLHGINLGPRGGQPRFPQLRDLKVGQSVDLPHDAPKPHIAFYLMAKKGGIRVSVKRIGEKMYRVTRLA